MHEIALEIGDVSLRLNKDRARLNKDAELRDAMRTNGDAQRVMEVVWETVREGLEGVGKGEGEGMVGKKARETTEWAVRVVGDLVCELASFFFFGFHSTFGFLPLFGGCPASM